MYNAIVFLSCVQQEVRPASTKPRQEDQEQEEPRLLKMSGIEEGQGRGLKEMGSFSKKKKKKQKNRTKEL